MEQKIDEIREHIYEIKLDLREHIRRTELNEEMLKLLREEMEEEKKSIEPVKKAYIGAKWSLTAIIIISGLVATLSRFL